MWNRRVVGRPSAACSSLLSAGWRGALSKSMRRGGIRQYQLTFIASRSNSSVIARYRASRGVPWQARPPELL